MKKEKKMFLSIIMSLVMMLSMTNVAFAATESGDVGEVPVDEYYAGETIYNAQGSTAYDFLDSFTVNTSTYCSIVAAAQKLTDSGTVEFYLFRADTGTTYAHTTFASGHTTQLWHQTLPAGTYAVRFYPYPSNTSYAYYLNVMAN